MKPQITLNQVNHTLSNDTQLEIDSLTISLELNSIIQTHSENGLSTILKLISGIISPEKGSILIYDQDLNYCNESIYKIIKKKLTFAYQHGVMLSNLTLMENLLLPINYHIMDLSHDEKLNLIIKTVSQYQLESLLEKRPVELSFMQRKLLGIIRAFIIDPEIVILDEPFQNLNCDYINKVQLILQNHLIKGNKLIIGTSQDTEFSFPHNKIDFQQFIIKK